MIQSEFEAWLAQYAPAPVPRRVRRGRMPRQRIPRGIEREYFKAIRGMLEDADRTLKEALFPLTRATPRTDADEPTRLLLNAIDSAQGTFLRRWSRVRLEGMSAAFGQRVADSQKAQLAKQTARLGVNVIAREPVLAGRLGAFAAENVSLIKSIPSRYFDEVEKLVTRAATAGLRHEVIAKEIAARFEVSLASAKLVARDQVGKLYGAIQQDRQTALGVTEYIWRTSNDERVREEHAVREGETFAWDSPPEDGHPGAAINCRCFAEPVIPA